MDYMWRYCGNEFAFQTEDPKIAGKMSRRKGFELFSRGVNCNFWVFLKHYSHPKHARRAFANLISKKIKRCPKSGVYAEKEPTPLRKKEGL